MTFKRPRKKWTDVNFDERLYVQSIQLTVAPITTSYAFKGPAKVQRRWATLFSAPMRFGMDPTAPTMI